jgi:glutathione synthase/RimK-type ligase-like ATP-grasp enzyme
MATTINLGVPTALAVSTSTHDIADTSAARVIILHENEKWLRPFRDALASLGVVHEEWLIIDGVVSISGQAPPNAVYYNRTSPSSHTRPGHRYAPEYTSAVLSWLESHGRRVINGHQSLTFELNKVRQEAYLHALGVPTPRTVAAIGAQNVLAAAGVLVSEGHVPFLLKHNRSGSGYGIELFHTVSEVEAYLAGPTYLPPVDGILLLQKYVKSRESYITRAEFVAGEFLYAVRIMHHAASRM